MSGSVTWRNIGFGERNIYKDRKEAAEFLAEKLKKKYGDQLKREKTVILAIPRGGVITGYVIAKRLRVGLDVLVSRKVGSPFNPELAIGAVMHDGSFFPNEDIIKMLDVPRTYIDEQIAIQMREIERRLLKFRGSKDYQLEGKFVILVDDGIATGATVFAAINWLRSQKIRKMVVAVPVGPRDTLLRLKTLADEVVVLQAPLIFGAGVIPIMPCIGGSTEFVPKEYHFHTFGEAAELILSALDKPQSERNRVSRLCKFSTSNYIQNIKQTVGNYCI